MYTTPFATAGEPSMASSSPVTPLHNGAHVTGEPEQPTEPFASNAYNAPLFASSRPPTNSVPFATAGGLYARLPDVAAQPSSRSPTFARVIVVSFALYPVCAGPFWNCAQSHAPNITVATNTASSSRTRRPRIVPP